MLIPRVKKLLVGASGLPVVAVLLISAVVVSAAGGGMNPASGAGSSSRSGFRFSAALAAQGCASASFAAAANFGTATGPISVTTGDFNEDGNLDLAVANFNSNSVSVLLSDGAGGFAAKVDYGTNSRPFSLTTADFNKDGNLDLAVTNLFSSNVSVLLGNGAGGFAPKADFGTGASPRGVTTGDFNKDGNADLAVANQDSNNVSVLLGDGTGGFAPKVDYPAGTTAFSVTTGDFNKDSNPDLAVANQNSNDVSVLLGDGAGGFATKVDYAAGSGPRYVATADFNKDGNPDLAVVNQDSNNISVLLGNGAGGFAAKVDYGTGTSPFSLTTADFNKDGNLDLAVANSNFTNSSSNTVSVLLGEGTGSFAPKVDFGTGANPFSVTAGDFNNDGRADLAVANFGSNTVSVLINSCVPLPNLTVNDVSQAEGNAGTTTFTFTISLDSPAPAGGVTFDASTADDTAQDGNPTGEDNDYVAKTETGRTIAAGATSTTFNVEVRGDTALETNERFFVNISNVMNANASDAQGAGTILNDDGSPTAGQIIISEFRLRGPAPAATPASGNLNGELDEFIELYNTTDSDFIVVDSSPLPAVASQGWAIVSSDAPTTAKFTIPVGARIPARGHYLVTNLLGYSLSSYAAADITPQEAGGGPASYNADIPDGSGLSLLRTGNPLLFATPSERLDAVGFAGSTFFEGVPLTPAGGIQTPLQHSFTRKLTSGIPQDTNDNEADFYFVEVNGAASNGRTSILGAPGPENSESPTQRNSTIKASLVDPAAASTAPPNRVRSGRGGLAGSFGTLSLQRRFRNATGAPVTRLRFRVVDITTRNTPAASSPQADLRVISSTGVVTNSQGVEVITVRGLTLETPPAQDNGGGLNSSLTVIPPGGSLAVGASINVQFLLSVQQDGNFRFLVNVEALTAQSGVEPDANLKTSATKAARSRKKK
jgi:hypothetical protein